GPLRPHYGRGATRHLAPQRRAVAGRALEQNGGAASAGGACTGRGTAGSTVVTSPSRFSRKGAVGSMRQHNQPVKVALVDLDGQTVPDWVRESLDRDGIEFVFHDCQTRADLAAHAADAEVVWLFGGSRVLLGGNLAAVPRCRAILRTGSGTDNVPVD